MKINSYNNKTNGIPIPQVRTITSQLYLYLDATHSQPKKRGGRGRRRGNGPDHTYQDRPRQMNTFQPSRNTSYVQVHFQYYYFYSYFRKIKIDQNLCPPTTILMLNSAAMIILQLMMREEMFIDECKHFFVCSYFTFVTCFVVSPRC